MYWFYTFNLYCFIFQRQIWKDLSVCLSILFTQMIGLLFDMFTATMFIFPFVRFLNMCKPRTGWRPPRFRFYGSGLASLPSWLGMVNAGWLGYIRSEIFLQMKFIIFQGCPSKKAVLLPGSPAPYNHLLIQPHLLVPECYFA